MFEQNYASFLQLGFPSKLMYWTRLQSFQEGWHCPFRLSNNSLDIWNVLLSWSFLREVSGQGICILSTLEEKTYSSLWEKRGRREASVKLLLSSQRTSLYRETTKEFFSSIEKYFESSEKYFVTMVGGRREVGAQYCACAHRLSVGSCAADTSRVSLSKSKMAATEISGKVIRS